MLTFIRKDGFNTGIVTQPARLHYNHDNLPLLQENIGQIGIFSA